MCRCGTVPAWDVIAGVSLGAPLIYINVGGSVSFSTLNPVIGIGSPNDCITWAAVNPYTI